MQTEAATFACQVRTFCEEMGWTAMAALVRRHHELVDFQGGTAELAPLLRLKHVKISRAKVRPRARLTKPCKARLRAQRHGPARPRQALYKAGCGLAK